MKKSLKCIGFLVIGMACSALPCVAQADGVSDPIIQYQVAFELAEYPVPLKDFFASFEVLAVSELAVESRYAGSVPGQKSQFYKFKPNTGYEQYGMRFEVLNGKIVSASLYHFEKVSGFFFIAGKYFPTDPEASEAFSSLILDHKKAIKESGLTPLGYVRSIMKLGVAEAQKR